MSLTHFAELMFNDLFFKQSFFGVWAEWQLPCDERSQSTSVKTAKLWLWVPWKPTCSNSNNNCEYCHFSPL